MLPTRGRKLFAAGVTVFLLALPAIASGAHSKFRVQLATVNSAGQAANGDSSTEGAQQLSGDGKLYVFVSQGNNLPGGDGVTYQAYVHNSRGGKTKLLSKKPNGRPADGFVNEPAISADGRFVSFDGLGTGLPGSGADTEVWIRNLKTGKTRLVSKAAGGSPAAGGNSGLSFPSADGRFVAFESSATNLPSGTGSATRAYVRDVKNGKTILASTTSTGDPALGHVYGQAISGNGKFVVFQSADPALPPKGPAAAHVYIHNMKSGNTSQVDRLPNGDSANGGSSTPSISLDGRYVAYQSSATNLPGGLTQGGYVFDRKTHKTRLVTRTSDGTPAEGSAVRISADGSVVTFESQDPLVTHGDGLRFQVFARNLKTGKTQMLSRTRKGKPGNADSYYTSLSPNGRFASFEGRATNLGGFQTITEGFRAGPIH